MRKTRLTNARCDVFVGADASPIVVESAQWSAKTYLSHVVEPRIVGPTNQPLSISPSSASAAPSTGAA